MCAEGTHKHKGEIFASVCIVQINGVFAVENTFSGPAPPIHVVESTCGPTQRVMCEVDWLIDTCFVLTWLQKKKSLSGRTWKSWLVRTVVETINVLNNCYIRYHRRSCLSLGFPSPWSISKYSKESEESRCHQGSLDGESKQIWPHVIWASGTCTQYVLVHVIQPH